MLPPAPEHHGFLRLHVVMNGIEQSIRLAVIPVNKGDSRFGINHAYPWPHLLDLSAKASITWVRDWSLKWHDVEPTPGNFTFAETDPQINRPLGHDMRVLGLLPFPSSYWASSVAAKNRFQQDRKGSACGSGRGAA